MLIPFKSLLFGVKKRILHYNRIVYDFKGYQAYLRFVHRMNHTARDLGMIHTKFRNPSGATWKSRISPKDLIVLGSCAIEYEAILDLWSLARCEVQVSGPHPRVLPIVNTVLESGKPVMGDYLIGGKSGSWGEDHKAHLFLCHTSQGDLLASVLAHDRSSFLHIYDIGFELCRIVEGESQTPYLSNLVKHGGGYAGLLTHTGNYVCQENVDHVYLPASTTKVMTALIALKANPSQAGTITIRPLDIMSGSGSAFFPGDMLSFQDALRVMMMESSNTMANAIARTVGGLPHSKDRV